MWNKDLDDRTVLANLFDIKVLTIFLEIQRYYPAHRILVTKYKIQSLLNLKITVKMSITYYKNIHIFFYVDILTKIKYKYELFLLEKKESVSTKPSTIQNDCNQIN